MVLNLVLEVCYSTVKLWFQFHAKFILMKCLKKHSNLKVTKIVPFKRSLINGSVISLGITRDRQCSDAAQIR